MQCFSRINEYDKDYLHLIKDADIMRNPWVHIWFWVFFRLDITTQRFII